MRQFYLLIEKGAPIAHQLMWSHWIELLPLKDINKINYYINQVKRFNLSKKQSVLFYVEKITLLLWNTVVILEFYLENIL